MKKTLYLLFIIVFFTICATPFIGRLLGYENVNAEKRQLAVAPQLVADGTLNMHYPQEFNGYFDDNFAFRTDLITMNAVARRTLFGESVSEKVVIGKDGWLYFADTLNDYMKVNVMTDNEITRLYRTLLLEQKHLESRGISFIFTVAPNKSSIYGEYMPNRYLVTGEKSNAEKLYALLDAEGFDYVNLTRVLLAAKDKQIYFKLDTHWNNKGVLLGYNALLDKVREKNPGFLFSKL